MLNGRNILLIGARAGGYGEGIARAAVAAGAHVYGTTLTPSDPQEQNFFRTIQTDLVDVPLRFDSEKRAGVFDSLKRIQRVP